MHRLVLISSLVLGALSLLIVGCGTSAAPTTSSAPNTVVLPNTPAPAPSVSAQASTVPNASTGPTLVVGTPAPQANPTQAPTLAPTTGAASSATVVPTTRPTTSASSSASTAMCNRSTFVSDVTMPDRTAVAPGQTFTKTWRMRNSGTCAWGSGYELVFFQGTSMSTTTVLAIPSTQPGATVDLSVPMTAPTTSGVHSGFWRMRAPNGSFFGSTIWVTVNVTNATPRPTSTP